MTFPRFLKRSSSEDDQLEHVINAWVRGDRHSELVEESPREALKQSTDLAEDALEFHRWADQTRRSDPAASGPAAETWNRVLRSTAQARPKGKKNEHSNS